MLLEDGSIPVSIDGNTNPDTMALAARARNGN